MRVHHAQKEQLSKHLQLYARPLVFDWACLEQCGDSLEAHYDPVGIATVCYGDTDPAMAIPGASYSREECLLSLERQLVAHAEPVLACTPGVSASPEMTAAFVSLAYNIGTSGFCKSTVARRFNSADYQGACIAIEMWNKAGGNRLPGCGRKLLLRTFLMNLTSLMTRRMSWRRNGSLCLPR